MYARVWVKPFTKLTPLVLAVAYFTFTTVWWRRMNTMWWTRFNFRYSNLLPSTIHWTHGYCWTLLFKIFVLALLQLFRRRAGICGVGEVNASAIGRPGGKNQSYFIWKQRNLLKLKFSAESFLIRENSYNLYLFIS